MSDPTNSVTLTTEAPEDEIAVRRAEAAPEGTRWEDVKVYRLYDRGRQAGTLTAYQRRMLSGVLTHRMCDNVAHKILFEHANRVELTNFEVDDTGTQEYLDEVWVKDSLADFSTDVHFSTIRDGNFAVGLNWLTSQDRPVVGRERWWDGHTGMFVTYDDNSLVEYAVKEWMVGKTRLRTVYYDDRIERFFLTGGKWERRQLPSDTEWPVAWVKRDGSPLHVPVVHFSARSDDDTLYGASLLAGGAIGLQDEINDIQRDITMAARMTAYQIYWATGVSVDTDSTGEVTPTFVEPGAFLENENPDAKYGVLPAGDMTQLIGAHQKKLQTIAYNTATPLHLITGGDWPSGEALLRSELPLVEDADAMVRGLKPAWATLAHRDVELANTFSSVRPLYDEDMLIDAVFAPTDRRDELTMAQIEAQKINRLILLQSLGFSQQYVLEQYGLSASEAQAMIKQKLSEQTAVASAGLAP